MGLDIQDVIVPLIAFLIPAIGLLIREIHYRRKVKRQAADDSGKVLKERKTLLEGMISKAEDPNTKNNLLAQLNEVDAALLGLHAQRLRQTLRDAGLPTEEELIANGHTRLKPEQATRLNKVIEEIKSSPSPVSAQNFFVMLGDAYYLLERYGEAKDIYDKIIDLNPSDHIAIRHRGAVYIHMKKYEDAITDFNRSLELKPDEPIALHDRGVALKDLGRYEAALEDFNHALESRPNNPIILQNRGVNYIHMKRYEDAFNDLKKSLELEKDHARTYYDMAYLLSLWMKLDDAFVYLAKAIKLDNKYREMAKTDEDFDNIREDPRFKKLTESN